MKRIIASGIFISILMAAAMLYSWSQRPRTVDDCVLKYAKPGMDGVLGRMAIDVCIDEMSKREAEAGELKKRKEAMSQDRLSLGGSDTESPYVTSEDWHPPEGGWNLGDPKDWASGEPPDSSKSVNGLGASKLIPALASNLVIVMLLWAICAFFMRAISAANNRGRLIWRLGIVSFFTTWGASALVNGQGSSSAELDGLTVSLYFGVPIVVSVLTMAPMFWMRSCKDSD